MNKYKKIKENAKRISRMKDATIIKYGEEIDFDDEISLYNVMMEHFVKGELDAAFLSSVTKGMGKSGKKELFDSVRPYVDLCFSKGDVNYWLDSTENASPTDYDFIVACILDNYNYLLEIAKHEGIGVLEQMVSLRENDDLRERPVVQYLRDSFVDDRALKVVLRDMAEKDSYYNMFSNEQKGTLLTYPEGTLYSYDKDHIHIISPYILGSRMFNDFHKYLSVDLIEEVTGGNIDHVNKVLANFFADDSVDFEDTVLDLSARYRDYMVQTDNVFTDEAKDIVYDDDGRDIQMAWNTGDGVLGSSYETPYYGGTK